MIENKVMYDGDVIFSIYHNGIDHCMHHDRKEDIPMDGKLLVFIERIVSDVYVYDLVKNLSSINGLVTPDNGLNPYNGDRISANITHYMSFDKPQSVFTDIDGEYQLYVDVEIVKKILAFIENYCGVNLYSFPIYLGDIFLVEPIELDLKRKCDEHHAVQGVTFTDVPIDSMLVVHFKKSDITRQSNYIVYSKIVSVDKNHSSIQIDSPVMWESIDIFVYKEGNLIYKYVDISFILSLQMNIAMEKPPIQVNLSRLGNMSIEQLPSEEMVVVGEPHMIDSIQRSNISISHALRELNGPSSLQVFHDGQEELARQYIIKQMQKASDSVYVIDCYFTDYKDDKGFDSIFDWLAILSNVSAGHKEIVYYVSPRIDGTRRALDGESLKQMAREHASTIDYYRQHNGLGIISKETKQAIHDRFIITKTNDDIVCLVIGTSINSLGNNYHCIHRYEGRDAQWLFNDIISNALRPENIDKEVEL